MDWSESGAGLKNEFWLPKGNEIAAILNSLTVRKLLLAITLISIIRPGL